MDNQKPGQSRNSPSHGSDRELLHNPVVEDFFAGLKHDMRRPTPGQEAIAAALQAIQRVAANSDTEDALAAEAGEEPKDRAICASCGGDNPATNRFCAKCGVPLQQISPRSESMKESAEDPLSSVPKSASAAEPTAPGQHYYHHHYHHHYFSPANEALPIASAEARAVQNSAVRDNRVRSPLGISSLSRAET